MTITDVDCSFSEGSSNIEIGTGEARRLEIVYDATRYHSNEEIRGSVQITTKGNTYEKFVIKLLGIACRKLTASGPIEVLNLEIGQLLYLSMQHIIYLRIKIDL